MGTRFRSAGWTGIPHRGTNDTVVYEDDEQVRVVLCLYELEGMDCFVVAELEYRGSDTGVEEQKLRFEVLLNRRKQATTPETFVYPPLCDSKRRPRRPLTHRTPTTLVPGLILRSLLCLSDRLKTPVFGSWFHNHPTKGGVRETS